MYITGVENMVKTLFRDGEWHFVLKCSANIKTPFVSADTELIYFPDEMTMDCGACSAWDKPACLVTKVERKNDAGKAD